MNTNIRIAGIVKESIVDGPGIRLVVFAQGCPHRCPGCHNPQTHDFNGGHTISIEDIVGMVSKNPLLDGLTLSGGEPFAQARALSLLGQFINKLGLNVITYTGYTYEYLMENADDDNSWMALLDCTHILIDGRFEVDKKNLLSPFTGSENQRIIHMGKTRDQQKLVLVKD